MKANALPHYDDSDNPTGCCPRFNPEGWDGQKLHFEDKDFVRATTKSAMHIPLNMGRVFARVQSKMVEAGAYDPDNFIVLSRDLSPWKAEHLFAVSAMVPDEEQVTLTGTMSPRYSRGLIEKQGIGAPKCKLQLVKRARPMMRYTFSIPPVPSAPRFTQRTMLWA